MTKKSVQVMVRMSPSLLEEIDADAEENERTRSQTIRLAIRQYLDRGTSSSER